ncbi:auxin efflux carrier [Suhomyces tanzawaensis NRRL Y-17324]|uniref:Auxin efflux carrier n=1 Tax=Suhomyces tanzawaensis NRRL Y-17324 TaxID=984487 RepID=A0A1E4SJZ6_9ASCO|nr:auxin efflux carrier [Suhomyces tanzawaensis NRRL Y-17324]ODV79757.1 auxin efflux carrier [Suhomyces tanzawaensis NRRL Y-17324]
MSSPLGLIIYAAVKPIFKIYFIIALGYFLAKRNTLSVTTCRDISDLVVTAIMPCLIFEQIITNLKSSDIKNLGIIFFTGTLLFSVGITLAYTTHLVTRSPKIWLGGILSVGLFPNISDLPIAYLQTLSKGDVVFSAEEGNKGVAYVCIFLAAQVLIQFCFGGYRLVQWDFREELKPKPTDLELTSTEDEKTSKQTHENKQSSESTTENNNDDTSIASTIEDSVEAGVNRSLEDLQHNEFLRVHQLNRSSSNSRSLRSGDDELRHRRGSMGLISTNFYSIHTQLRTTELRKQKTQDIHDVINEYSEFDNLKNRELRQIPSGTVESTAAPVLPVEVPSTHENTLKYKIKKQLRETGKNMLQPNSVSLIVSLAIAMSPPLKALFVPTHNFHLSPAPDNQPPLSFLMDLASYVGAASVPLGLILLGATISRLQVKSMPPGFWKTAVMITCCRLILLPMIGVGITTGLHKAGWYGSDPILRFVSVLEFGLPSATSLVYFTAFYTDPHTDDHPQMDCLAVCLIAQYLILYITLPFLVTFTFKVSLGY